ncbi:hypothetical protein PIROE2DRAFT_14225 [Piromyces sp. E2]|nr:hypothetical protein PIROE2DRAFT_14225 [Piromyces sp. E2]|eukprot:OUM60099.1 hypothetical protein PIROE2DRAFT_14225 [Piromyces sp. E2]
MGLFQKNRKHTVRDKNEFIQKLKSYIDNEDRRVLNEDFFEWKVKNWNTLSDNNFSPKFTIVEVKNERIKDDNFAHVTTKIVMFIRNPYDYKKYHCQVSSFENFNKYHNSVNFNLIKRSDLFPVDGNSLLENNKGTVGVYIRTYFYDKDNLLEEIKWKEEYKEDQQVKEYFWEWKMIEIWKILEGIPVHSPKFMIDNKEWIIKLNSDYKYSESSFFININVINIDKEPSTNNKYTQSKMIVYIRNCSDYSCYNYGICNSRNGISFKLPKNISGYIGSDFNKTPIERNQFMIGVYLYTSIDIKKKFLDKIKNCIHDENRIVEGKGHFELPIDQWNQLSDGVISTEYTVCDHKWQLELFPNGLGTSTRNRNFVTTRLKNIDSNLDDFTHICVKKVFYIRNSKDYFCYKLGDDESLTYYSKNYNAKGCKLIEHINLYTERGNTNHSIIENNSCVVGVYFRIYKYEHECYKNEMKYSLCNENREVRGNGFYEWNIENWNQLFNEDFSSIFNAANYSW